MLVLFIPLCRAFLLSLFLCPPSGLSFWWLRSYISSSVRVWKRGFFHLSAFVFTQLGFCFSIISSHLQHHSGKAATSLGHLLSNCLLHVFARLSRLGLAVEASPSIFLKYLVLLSPDHALLLHFCSLVPVICKSGGSLDCCSFLGGAFCIVLPRLTINPQLSQTVLFTLLLLFSVVCVECCFMLNYWMHGKSFFQLYKQTKKKHVRSM